jgi:sulfonate transport system ATP-binding protein
MMVTSRDSLTMSRSGAGYLERTAHEATRFSPAPRDAGLAIELSHVAKSFDQKRVLTDVDLKVGSGEFIAIVGRSGCGKSTLLRLIAGLAAASDGSVRVAGRVVREQVSEARIMFQDARLLPWRRALDNVGIGQRGNWRPAALDALAHVGLEDRAGDWPSILSGGQRQRVALARALVSRPKLLLLDEPFGALDALTRLEMQRLLERVWQEVGFTAVLVTHDVAEAVALADRILVLENGRVAAIRQITRDRPRVRHDAMLAEIEGGILEHLMATADRP